MTLPIRIAALVAGSLLLLAPPASAQSDLEKKRDKKLNEAWFKANDWTSDYDEARKRAKETGKVIFAYFTRSYAY
ncbi:MAG: hypothetical protein D6731_00400 [Planctomycetota bacterium]|nr:MAG: hypothetical protein D6731_00400 [Planctomycetota bacterium]